MINIIERSKKVVSSLNPGTRATLFGLLFSGLILLITLFHPTVVTGDGYWYRLIATGHINMVNKPFATRVLHPIIVSIFARGAHLNIDQSFWLVNGFVIFLFVFALAYLFESYKISYAYLILFLCSPFFLRLSTDYYLNDSLFAALLTVFVIALYKQSRLATMFVFILLFLTRESTLLISVALIATFAYYKDWRQVISFTFISVVGIGLLAYLGKFGQGNIHHLGSFVYSALKIPFNSLHDLFGITLSSNALQTNDGGHFCNTIWQMTLPRLPVLGAVHQIGICPWSSEGPLFTLTSWLTVFGFFPLLLVLSFTRTFRTYWSQLPRSLQAVSFYGALTFVLAPCLGDAVNRLIAMSWPVFVLGLPWLVTHNAKIFFVSRRLITLQIMITWLPWLSLLIPVSPTEQFLITDIISIILYFIAYPELVRRLQAIIDKPKTTLEATISS